MIRKLWLILYEWELTITKNLLKKIQFINQNNSRNQALFKWKSFLTVELYLFQGIWGIRSIWGELGPNTPNGLGYTESNAKSSTLHLVPNEVFRLISIQAFQVIIKICWSNKKFKAIVSSTPSVSSSKPLSSCIDCPLPTKIYLDFHHRLYLKHHACEGIYF